MRAHGSFEPWLCAGVPSMRIALAAASLVVVYLAIHGLLVLAGGGSGYDSAAERAGYGLGQVAIATGIVAGLLISSRRQRTGMILIAGSVAALSVLWYWFLVVTIPVGLGLVWLAYLRGRTRGMATGST